MRQEYACDMPGKLSDRSATPRIGIVLSSGGVRGVYAHTGFLQAIHDLGIPITASAGCSAGALVGGFIASGTSLEQWAVTLADITSRTFWTPDSLLRFIWRMAAHRGRGYTGLSDTSAALEFTHENLAVSTFEECLYPFHVLAVNLGTGRKVVFSEGKLAPSISALPVNWIPPWRIHGQCWRSSVAWCSGNSPGICAANRSQCIIAPVAVVQL